MTQPIDVAYVDIVARDKSIDKLRKDLDKTFDAIDQNIGKHLQKIDDAFDETFESIDESFKETERVAEKAFESVTEHAERAFSDVDDAIGRHDRRTRSRFAVLSAAIGDALSAIGRRTSQFFGTVFRTLGDQATKLLGVIGQLGGALGSFVSSSPLLALILALIPAIIALAAALSNLIGLVGLLPSGLGVLISAIAPVVIAFQNFGEAVSAIADGDLEKINEAMKKLSPSAASVAREIGNLLPSLRAFQRLVQEAFFVQIRGGLTQLITSFLPVMTTGFQQINTEIGQFIRQLINMLTTTDSLQRFQELFASTARIIDLLTGPVIRLFDAINASVHESLPFVERIAAAFGRALDSFTAFLNKSIETGDFDKFIEDALTTVKELIDLLGAAAGLIGTLFTGTEEAGHNLIKTLTDMLTKLDEFFQSAQGQDVLRDLSIIVDVLGASLLVLINTFIFLDHQFRVSLAILELIGRGFFDLIEVIGDFFGKIPEKFEQFKQFVSQIPEAIVGVIKSVFDTLLQTIGVQIGLVLFAIQVLPQQIVDFIGSIPQRIGDSLASTGPTILDIFKKAFDDANAFITQKFDEIVTFIQSVPDRIIALGPIFLSAGKNLITSFMNGFRSVGSFIGDIAGDIVSSVKGFLNRAIDRINSGIAAIDAVLPGNLGRIPRLAQGAIVGHTPGGILANVGEGREDEVVAPLSKLEDIIRNAFGGGGPGEGGMTVNFAAGAISVGFSGSVPTEAEARTVGRAVGDGIADQLARRNVRTQVRAA